MIPGELLVDDGELDVSDVGLTHRDRHLAAIGRADEAAHRDRAAVENRMRRDRRVTASPQPLREFLPTAAQFSP